VHHLHKLHIRNNYILHLCIVKVVLATVRRIEADSIENKSTGAETRFARVAAVKRRGRHISFLGAPNTHSCMQMRASFRVKMSGGDKIRMPDMHRLIATVIDVSLIYMSTAVL
jgi:hypothetical protein